MKSTFDGHVPIQCALGVAVAIALAFVSAILVFATPVTQAQTYTVLYSFKGYPEGFNPVAELIQDGRGRLYGTTSAGGIYGWGTVFEWNPKTGREKVLYNFTGFQDGASPSAALVRDKTGILYGTAFAGGDMTDGPCNMGGCGVVFKLDPNGIQTVLYTFTGAPDAANPVAKLFRDSKGDLYGTTQFGGTSCGDQYAYRGCGAVFKIDANGNYTLLHRFKGSNGKWPIAGLVTDGSYNLYGTTYSGAFGTSGTIYKITKRGKETKLGWFNWGCCTGVYPSGALVRDASGDLYGTTRYGAHLRHRKLEGYGSIFKLDAGAGGYVNELYSFTGGADGATPYAGLVRDSAGNLYGTTESGGAGYGVVFKLDAAGNYTVLHTFTGLDGANPYASLLLGANGNLFGTTYAGGDYNYGVIFEITPE